MSQIGTITVGAKLAGGTQQAFKAIADGMRTMAKAMSSLADDTKKLGSSAQSQAFGKMAGEMNKVSDAMQKAIGGWGELAATSDKTSKSVSEQASETAKLTQELEKQQKEILGVTAKMTKQEAEAASLRIRYQELVGSSGELGQKANTLLAAFAKEGQHANILRAEMGALNKSFMGNVDSQGRFHTAIDKTNKRFHSLLTSTDKFGAKARAAAQDFRKLGGDVGWFELKLKEIQVAQKKNNLVIKQSGVAADSLRQRYDKLINSEFKYAKNAQLVIDNLRKTNISIADARRALFTFNKEWQKTEAGKNAAIKLTERMEVLRTKFKAIITDTDRFAGRSKILFAAFDKGQLSLKQLETRLAALNVQYKKQVTAVAQANQAALKARNAASKLEIKYKELIGSSSKYAVTAKRVTQMLRDQQISAERAAISLQKLNQRQLDSIGPVTQAWQRLGRSFKTYMSYVAASSTIFAFISAARTATQTVIDFDQALKDLQAITRATDAEVLRMSERIKQVASDTKFSAIEVAEGMKLLGQSGLSAQESINTIGAVSDLATGTLTDLATTVDLVTTAMRVWGIESENSSHIADVFANAVNRSKLTIDKIRTSLNYIGPVAQAAGASLEETASAMMIMANQGIRASTIGTGLRQVFRRIVQPSTAMKQAIEDANLTMADFDIRSKGLQKVLDNLRKVVDDNADAFAMFGQRGATAVLAMVKGGGAALEQMMTIVERTGAAADMAAIQMEGLGVSFKNLQDKVKNLYLAMGDGGLAGALRIFVDVARTAVDLMTGAMNNSMARFTVQVGALAAGVWGLTKAFQLLGKWLGITSAISALTGAIQSYTAATNLAAVATTRFGNALKILSATMRRFGPFIVVGAVLGLLKLIDVFSESREEAEANLRSIKALRDSYEDSAIALQGLLDVLKDTTATEEEKAEVLDRLVRAYPELSSAVKKARGDMEALTPAIEKQIKKMQELADIQTLAQMRKQFSLAIQAREEADKAARQLRNADTDEERARFATLQQDKLKIYNDYLQGIAQSYNDYAKRHNESLVELLPPVSKNPFSNKGDRQLLAMKQVEDANDRINNKAAEQAKKAQQQKDQLIAQERELIALYEERLQVGEEVDMAMIEKRAADVLDVSGFSEEDYEQDKASFDKLLAYKQYQVEISEALGLRTHEDALSKKYLDEMEHYDKLIERARLFHEEARIIGDEEAAKAAASDIDKFQAAQDQAKLKRLQYFAKEHSSTEKELTKLVKDQEDKKTKYRETTDKHDKDLDTARINHKKAVKKKEEDLERAYQKKVVDINKALEDKLTELRKKRVQAEKDAKNEILSIENSFAEKMLGLEQRGMSDKEKELSNESFAREQFSKAQAQASKAIRDNDLEALEIAKELYASSEEYFGNLADTSAARSGLTAVKDGYIAIAKAQNDIKQKQIAAEEATAGDEAKTKAAEAKAVMEEQLQLFINGENDKLNVVQDRIAAERLADKARHDEFMQARDAEIQKLNEELNLIKQAQQQTLNANTRTPSTPGAPLAGDFSTGAPIHISQDSKKELVKVHEQAAAEGIAKGIKDKKIETAMESVSGTGLGEKIAEDVNTSLQDTLFKDVKVEGMPLEDWKKMGEEQGQAAGESAGEAIAEEVDKAVISYSENGQPVSIKVEANSGDVDGMLDAMQDTFEDSPFDIAIDESEARRLLEVFVRDAQNRYKITIPVTVAQGRSEGGPVYHMNSGGRLPGQSSPHDSLNVKARPGEWFIKNESVAEWQRRIGDWFMPGVNRPNSTPGRYLQSLLVHGTQKQATADIPNMGKMTIALGGKQAEIMGTPVNLKTFANMMQDVEAYSS